MVAEIATGGDPSRALTKYLASLDVKPGVHHVQVAHDEGCPCTEEGKPVIFCTCEILEVNVR